MVNTLLPQIDNENSDPPVHGRNATICCSMAPLGNATLRLMQYTQQLALPRASFDEWVKFVREFYSDTAMHRVSFDAEVHQVADTPAPSHQRSGEAASAEAEPARPVKSFDLTVNGLARVFFGMHSPQSHGTTLKKIQIVLDHTSEYYTRTGAHMVHCAQASAIYWYENGAEVVHYGSLDVLFNTTPYLKIEYLHLHSRSYKEYLPRSVTVSPESPVAKWGCSAVNVRLFEINDTLLTMRDLITFSIAHKLPPSRALQSFAAALSAQQSTRGRKSIDATRRRSSVAEPVVPSKAEPKKAASASPGPKSDSVRRDSNASKADKPETQSAGDDAEKPSLASTSPACRSSKSRSPSHSEAPEAKRARTSPTDEGDQATQPDDQDALATFERDGSKDNLATADSHSDTSSTFGKFLFDEDEAEKEQESQEAKQEGGDGDKEGDGGTKLAAVSDEFEFDGDVPENGSAPKKSPTEAAAAATGAPAPAEDDAKGESGLFGDSSPH